MSPKTWIMPLALLAAPALAAPENFTLDVDHTFPSLEFPHMGLSVWRGKFNKTTGKAVIDRTAKTGSVEVVVDISSIDFGHDGMNDHAVKKEWLDAAQFPKMTYKGSFKYKGDAPDSVDGQLTLKGITKPLKLKVNSFKCMEHPFYKKLACGADAEGEVNRAEFGMPQYTEGGMGIIKLRIQVEALKDDVPKNPSK